MQIDWNTSGNYPFTYPINPTTLPEGRAVEYVRLTRTRYILFAHTGEL